MDSFVARQPIFDHHLRVIGYELLFRSSPENVFLPGTDIDRASSSVIADSVLASGLSALTAGQPAYINLSRTALVGDFATLLPKDRVVLEILESVDIDDEVVEACQRLKRAGYVLALDDVVGDDGPRAALIDLVDIIKVDFLGIPEREARGALTARLRARGPILLAEKVETHAVFEEASHAGYVRFQGYFFARPVMTTLKAVPAFRLNYLRLLREVSRPELKLDQLEQIIKQELSMSYRLLRYVNSAAFAFLIEITSIRQALILVGQDQIRKWASVWALAGVGGDRPVELVVASSIRALLCESLAAAAGLGDRASDLFLMGMLSMIDAILDRPMEQALETLSLPYDVQDALLGGGNRLRLLLDCVTAFERGDWNASSTAAAALTVDEELLAHRYLAATSWAGTVFGGPAGQNFRPPARDTRRPPSVGA